MNTNRINYKLKVFSGFVREQVQNLGLASNYIIAIFVMLVLIFFLITNVIGVYQRGTKNISQINAEKQKLRDLEQEAKLLQQELEYRQSKQFIEAFARENLSLKKGNEQLYQVDREEEIEYQVLDKVEDPIDTTNKFYWWKKIFLKQ